MLRLVAALDERLLRNLHLAQASALAETTRSAGARLAWPSAIRPWGDWAIAARTAAADNMPVTSTAPRFSAPSRPNLLLGQVRGMLLWGFRATFTVLCGLWHSVSTA